MNIVQIIVTDEIDSLASFYPQFGARSVGPHKLSEVFSFGKKSAVIAPNI